MVISISLLGPGLGAGHRLHERHPRRSTGAAKNLAAGVDQPQSCSTTAIAAAAQAADVPLEVDGAEIPLYGFAQLTLIATALGALLAKACTRWSSRPHARFVAITVALTALSCVPDLSITATTATKVVLIGTHLAAAAIVIPLLARQVRTG